jgi:hypothetical protein
MLAALIRFVRQRPFVIIAWLLAAALTISFAWGDLSIALYDERWRVASNTKLGRDFANVFTAGQLMWDGDIQSIYDVQAYRDYQSALFDGAVRNHNYSYAPVSFFYVWLFALLPYSLSYFLWIGLTGAAFYVAARPYLNEAGLPGWFALIIPAAAANVWAGHYGFLIGALWLGAWRLLETRPRLAGVLIGLMLVKPHLAVLMPIVLARRGAWTAFLYAALTCVGLIVSSGLIFGWQLWETYLTDTAALQAAMVDNVGEFFFKMMPTVVPAALLLGAGMTLAWVLQVGCAIAVIAALWIWMPRDSMRAGLAAGCATFLVLPYAFNYDLTVVGIAALIALHRGAASGIASIVFAITAMLAFLLPLSVVELNKLGVPAAPPLIAFLLCAMLARGRWAIGSAERKKDAAPVAT